MKWTRWGIVTALVLLMSATVFAQDAQTPEALCEAATPAEEPATREYAQPEDVLEDGVDYLAVICTEAGPITVDLYEDLTPLTVNNFVFLAQEGYYNNTTFHRVMEGFMAQAGDPTGTGAGGPGYQFADEFLGFLTFDRAGLLAMANAGAGTNGSQFFITYDVTDWLNYAHTIFGDVVDGMDNAEALSLRDPQANPEGEGDALDTVIIVTDPATLDVELPESATPATVEEMEEAMSALVDAEAELGLTYDTEVSGSTTAEDVVAAAPESVQEDYSAALAENGFNFRHQVKLNNTECVADYGFDFVQYTTDAFETTQGASAVLNSGILDEVNTADGFEKVEDNTSGLLQFNRPATDCTGAEAVDTRVYLQRGRYLVRMDSSFVAELAAQYPLDRILGEQFIQLFESFLVDVYSSER